MSLLVIGAKYTRPELAERWGYSSHHAIGKGVVTPQGEKVVILFVTRIKQEALTQYEDALSGDLLFWEGQEKHGTDDRVIDAQKAGDEVHLFYREIHHTPFEYMGQVFLLSHQRGTGAPSRFVFRLEHDQGAIDDLERFVARSTRSLRLRSERSCGRRAWVRVAFVSSCWNGGGRNAP
jgi:putative restriction endonuclease